MTNLDRPYKVPLYPYIPILAIIEGLAIFGVEVAVMKSTALTLNIFVSLLSFYAFYKSGNFKIKILLPFILGSTPMAFIGARMNVDPKIYKVTLVFFLLSLLLGLYFSAVKKLKTLKK